MKLKGFEIAYFTVTVTATAIYTVNKIITAQLALGSTRELKHNTVQPKYVT